MAEIPAVELLQEAGGAALAELAHCFAHEEHELRHDLLAGRLATVAIDDLAQHPGIALGAPAHHHRGGTGRRQHRLRLRSRRHVAGGDHRHVHERHQLGGQRVIGGAGVHLLRGAGMERQRGRPRFDKLRPNLETGPGAVAQAAPHLDGDRNVDGARDRFDDRAGAGGVIEQRRAGTGLRHLPHRAAEVDVDQICTSRLDHPRRLRHHEGIRAEDLDRERVLVSGDAEIAEGALVAVLDACHGDHLRAHEAGAVAAALAPERLYAHARHRRQHEARRDLDVADAPALAQLDRNAVQHCLRMVDAGIDRSRIRGYHSRPRRRSIRRRSRLAARSTPPGSS